MGTKRTMLYAALAATVLAVAPNGFAGQKPDANALRKTVTILQDATLNGAPVAQGQYDAEITGDADATLVLRRDKKEVARAHVRRTALAVPAKYDRVDVRSRSTGKEVVALFFKGDPRTFEVVDDTGVALVEKP